MYLQAKGFLLFLFFIFFFLAGRLGIVDRSVRNIFKNILNTEQLFTQQWIELNWTELIETIRFNWFGSNQHICSGLVREIFNLQWKKLWRKSKWRRAELVQFDSVHYNSSSQKPVLPTPLLILNNMWNKKERIRKY